MGPLAKGRSSRANPVQGKLVQNFKRVVQDLRPLDPIDRSTVEFRRDTMRFPLHACQARAPQTHRANPAQGA